VIADTAQSPTRGEINGPQRVKQGFKDRVLIEEGQSESLCELTGDSSLAARRQARDDDEAMIADARPTGNWSG
jgi:hypothetical protein